MKKQRLIGWLTVQLRDKQKTRMFFTLTRNHKLVWKRVFETSFRFCYSLFNASLFSLCFAKQNKRSAPKLPWMNGIEYSISVNDRWQTRHTFWTLTACITDIKLIENSYPASSLARQRTTDSPKTDFSIILRRHTAVTQHGMVYSCKRLHARNKTNSSFTKRVFPQGHLYQASFPQVQF